MAFRKTATVRAEVVRPQVSTDNWYNFRDGANGRIKVAGDKSSNLVHKASEIFGEQFNPDNYLLTHCTIVCSVDTVNVPRSKLGNVVVDGQRINRKWANFRVSPETDKFINNNLDCWSREVLKASSHTFVGAHNFCEHIQVEELSKGRIIDAAIRDIGLSLYTDILVATNRKHSDLITAIETDKMNTLSMGCSVLHTTCTKCGNVAVDDTELCSHIKYFKGKTFQDPKGNTYRIAELCGHHETDPTGGVNFIEASWVEAPAFPGAVKRNILEADIGSVVARQAEKILSTPPPQWGGENLRAASGAELSRFAESMGIVEGNSVFSSLESGLGAENHTNVHTKTAFNDLDDENEEEEGDDKKEEPSTMEDAKKEVYETLLDEAKELAIDEIRKKEQEEAVENGELGTSLNNTLHQANSLEKVKYSAALDAYIHTSKSDAELLNNLALFNRSVGIHIPVSIYRTVLRVGSTSHYPTKRDFLGACRKEFSSNLHKDFTTSDRVTLLRLGNILHLRAQFGLGNTESKESPDVH